jgi:hypothetical protein
MDYKSKYNSITKRYPVVHQTITELQDPISYDSSNRRTQLFYSKSKKSDLLFCDYKLYYKNS